MTDEELARAATRGDAGALDELLRRHTALVHGVCRRVLGNPDDALDATQEALISIALKIAAFDGRSKFTTWCYRIATNAALDETRRRKRRPMPAEETPDPPVAGPEESVTDRLIIDEALARLGPDARAAVALRDLVGLDYAEIAEVLDIPPGTVRSRIARGRAALADILGNQEPPDRRPRVPESGPES